MPTKPPGRCPTCHQLPPCNCGENRPGARDRGYNRDHETRFRPAVLARDPWCVLCLQLGARRRSTDADHWPLSRRQLLAHGLDPNDPDHGRGLCSWHHHSETARLQPAGYAR